MTPCVFLAGTSLVALGHGIEALNLGRTSTPVGAFLERTRESKSASLVIPAAMKVLSRLASGMRVPELPTTVRNNGA